MYQKKSAAHLRKAVSVARLPVFFVLAIALFLFSGCASVRDLFFSDTAVINTTDEPDNSTDTPTTTPSPTPAPEFSQYDLDALTKRIDMSLGRYRIEDARGLLGEAREKNLADADWDMFREKINSFETFQTDLAPYEGDIEHLFTHCLIAFPEICYAGNDMSRSLDNDCITPLEFKKILNSLYENDYILVDINLVYSIDEGDVARMEQLYLPKGKKPLILSIDDVTYDARKMHTGMVDKLIVDEEGRVATYTRHLDGTEVISRDNEIFPILDDFVIEHPNFSFQGAKGTLSLTGFQGVFGYRVQSDAPEGTDYEEEKAGALAVVAALRDNGWNFGSHSYGHGHMREKMGLEQVQADTASWKKDIEPIVGETKIFFYPYGESVDYGGAKFNTLRDAGFRLFCGVWWRKASLEQLPGGMGILQFRRNVDGYTLRNSRDAFIHMFDTNEVIDPIRADS